MASHLPPMLPASGHRAIRSSGKPHSCAECRRLKLRCDRVFPCESCRKRNVAALCPNGSLPPRPRLLAEDAVKLSKTIAELTNRCRQLEDALRALQAQYSNEGHPLLETTLLTSNHGQHDGLASPVHESFNQDENRDELDSINDSLGTLTIDSSGNPNFLGRTAGMTILLQSEDTELRDLLPHEIQNIISESLSTPVMFASHASRKAVVVEHMRQLLPSQDKAWALCDMYFQHAAWLCHPISREYLMDEIFPRIYNLSPTSTSSHEEEGKPPAHPEAHELAMLFMVFSLATLLDLTLMPNNHEAEFYHQLARVGLSCVSILVEPTVPAIQTLILMSYYHWLGNRKQSEQISWGIMGLVVNLAQNIGLHRDSEVWRLVGEKAMERQRLLFWELYALELTEALNFGRPPSLSLSTIDCKMPVDATQFAFKNDDLSPPFNSVKYRFFSIFLAPVIDAILGAKTANYSTVLVLDRQVRDQKVAPLMEFDRDRAPGAPIFDLTGPTLGVTMQKFMIVAWPHLTLLYLHRGYFVRAISEHQPPNNILEGRYAPSLLAIFRSSCVMIAMLEALEKQGGDLAKRYWLYWCHGLAAAIVVASIVAKAPESPLAQPALDQIQAAYMLFHRAAEDSMLGPNSRPAKAFAVVTRLRARALAAFTRSHAGKHAAAVADVPENSDTQDEELHILGGHTRILGRTSTPAAPAGNSPGSANSPESPQFHRSSPNSGCGQRGFTPETLEKAHPSLLADLRSTKERKQRMAPPSNYTSNMTAGAAAAAAGPSSGSLDGFYPGSKFADPSAMHSTSPPQRQQGQPDRVQQQPSSNHHNMAANWANNNGNHSQLPHHPHPPYLVPNGFLPVPAETQSAFGMLGSDPDWGAQLYSFMGDPHYERDLYDPSGNLPASYGTQPMKTER